MPHTNSDSEDDPDYVPPADDHGSDSSDEQDDVVHAAEGAQPETDPAEQKKQRDALWASFQASVSTPPSHAHASAVTRIQVERTYLFAGKHVREVVEVPEDSEEAKKWPCWSPESAPETQTTAGRKSAENPAPPSPSPALTPRLTRPGPRQPNTALPSIPKASHAKKITTLDKSAMDWHAHVASESNDVKHELDANRRGGGYLDKVDFLKRVQDRREDAFEASKTSKRRKT